MVSIDKNKQIWRDFDWDEAGEEWSIPWGSSRTLWHGTILPRICTQLPCGDLLEIAPGWGRVTQYLLPLTNSYVGVDVTPECVEACKSRFGEDETRRFEVNDGLLFPTLPDGSIDYVFSWDSLVHASAQVLDSYLQEIRRVLRPGGSAFIHHSNLGAFSEEQRANIDAACPGIHLRDASMSAELFRGFCKSAGLTCRSQELIAWIPDHLVDCLSVCSRVHGSSEEPSEPRLREHYFFMEEARNLFEIWKLHDHGASS